jgi:hypothetical protein
MFGPSNGVIVRWGLGRTRVALCRLLLACAVGALALPVAGAGPAVADPAPPVWLGPDGAPLPFESEDDVLEFLRTAEVVSRERTPDGITRPEQLLLEADGVRAHAIFRSFERELRRTRRPDGRYYVRWVDHYGGECAAYELAQRLGLGIVPPTVARRLGSNDGSVQLWIEGDRDETAPGFQVGSPIAWMKRQWDMSLFDNLILNVDRNAYNTLVDPDDRLWLIDHTRAFQPKGELLDPEKLQKVNRVFWDRLQSMSDEELKDVVRDHVALDQMVALVERRAVLAERVQALVDEHGEGAVFY